MRPRTTRQHVAIVTILSLILSPAGFLGWPSFGGLSASQGTPAAKPAAPAANQAAAKPASAAAPTPAPLDGGWPRPTRRRAVRRSASISRRSSSWTNQKQMTFYAAVSYTRQGGDKPALGTIKAEADTKVSVTERLVDFSVLRITESNFPDARQAAGAGDCRGGHQGHRRSRVASSRSIACSPASTRARSSRRTSKA